ncbi:hypothetical protein PR003_g10541 [Phytophthora rubi]|uniref:Uncharacterized protein n=1 Tax=Phytophthora rubi TaxID=129364 RepID=A0A6A4FDF1_9STRA|nr:hypothetical protein PR002_g10252 [Phytophthora rubi]KAE9340332.1 hypothetical protein PR003_g10541 [Phytophthora rubi]
MSAIGVIKYRKQRSSIKMPENATFLDEICDEVKAAGIYNDSYAGKKIIACFRNAPAHSQTEVLVPEREGLVLLHLGPCISCETLLKTASSFSRSIKDYLVLCRREMGRRSVLMENGRHVTLKERNTCDCWSLRPT